MKNSFRTYPNLSRMLLASLLLATALIGSGLVHMPFVPLGAILVILVTWLMLRSEGKDLSALGFDLQPARLLLIPMGLLMGILSYLLSFYAGVLVRGDNIAVNNNVNWAMLLSQFWQILPTAAVQDFIVAGYCYQKLIQLTNKRLATVAFALFFISMHDVWGGFTINTFFYASSLFLGYLMFSSSLLRSGSIWLVIGVHWGNNFTNTCLFTYNHAATSWLYISGTPHNDLNAWQAIGLYIALIIGSVSVIIVNRLIWKQADGLLSFKDVQKT